MAPPEQPNPKVFFISYSHDSPEHAYRVLALTERFRKDGLDAQLDQYVAGTLPEGWAHWMLNRLDEADFALSVAPKPTTAVSGATRSRVKAPDRFRVDCFIVRIVPARGTVAFGEQTPPSDSAAYWLPSAAALSTSQFFTRG